MPVQQARVDLAHQVFNRAIARGLWLIFHETAFKMATQKNLPTSAYLIESN